MLFIIGLPVAMLFIFPLSLVKKMSGFRYVSVFSLLALLYILLVLLIELPGYINHNFEYSRLVFAKWDINIFSSCAITFFAFSCHIEALEIYDELQNPTMKRAAKMIGRSVALNFVFYIMIGLSGYFSTYEMTNKLVIERAPLPGQARDIPMLVGTILIVLLLIVAYPMNMIPIRSIFVYKMLGTSKTSKTE